jgi:hypothetical protein
MIIKAALSVHEQVNDLRGTRRLGGLLGILVVLVPFAFVGGVGEWLGDDTPLGPILINLAYLLSIGIASLVLKSRGSGWRKIGLARPDSWRTTVLVGVGVTVSTILTVLGDAAFRSKSIQPIAWQFAFAAHHIGIVLDDDCVW